jgi:lipoyl-dependent peroxiredoxin
VNSETNTVKNAEARVVYTARVHSVGGRDGGTSKSDDARLEVRHSLPGTHGIGTNPEQLFAASWSSCFAGAMSVVARRMKIALPLDTFVDAEIDLVLRDDGYSIHGRLNIHSPRVPRDVLQSIVDAAERSCPLSKATRGNIYAVINIK